MALVLDGNGPITGLSSLTFPSSNGSITGLANAAIPATKIGAGAALQIVYSTITSGFSTSSTSYVASTNGNQVTITSTVANSKFLVLNFVPAQLPDSNILGQTSIRSSVDSYASNLAEVLHANYGAGNGGWKMTAPLTVLHSPGQPAGTAITYKGYLRVAGGSNSIYWPDNWGQSFSLGFYVMEIAS